LFVFYFYLILSAVLFFHSLFLIPIAFLILILYLFLLFFMGVYIKRTYSFSEILPGDPYQIHSDFEKLKKQYKLKNVRLLKIKDMESVYFYFNSFKTVFIVLSEDILENFNIKDILCFLSYAFQKGKSGDVLFLTVLSSFLFLWEKVFFILSYPLFFLKKNKKRSLFFMLKFLSLISRNVFYKNDKLLFKTESQKKDQALSLWKLDNFTRFNLSPMPLFLSPLFLTKLLTNYCEKDYISLQPLIKNRIKNLLGSYPP
ncbi:MAG: hypothetical protein OXC37_02500, partial [Bdellovibrionaceae bacterium]|nr:hypothetical protein [Pseudobdellovibrionaceae bacterium]